MYLITLFSLSACNTSTPQSVVDGQRIKDQLEVNMLVTIASITSRDPSLGAEANALLELFHDHFAPLVFEEHGTEMTVSGIATCRVPAPVCLGFAAPHHDARDRHVGGWMDRASALFISDELPPNDIMAPFVALHELKHSTQYLNGDPADPLPRVAGERWPRERGATEFEINLERVASNGRFDHAVEALVAASNAGALTTVTYGNVVYPKLDGVAEEIFPGISPIGTELLDVSIMYAFNVALLTDTSEEARERTISTLQVGLADPAVHALYNYQ